MANNNYILNGSSLTSIADAIRSKSGSSQKLTFPDEFVSAINNISTGMEPTFNIVGSTSQPSSPTENTIWINTSTTISKWQISSIPPTSAVQGQVWIVTALHTNTFVDVINDNKIILQPTKAYQYQNNEWTEVSMRIYQNGSWNTVSADVVLYESGVVNNTAITGGWYASTSTESHFDHLPMKFYNGLISTSYKIDLTQYSLLKVTIQCNSGNSSSIGIGTTTTAFTSKVSTTVEDVQQTLSIDLSSVSGSYYILAHSASSSSSTQIYKVELIA